MLTVAAERWQDVFIWLMSWNIKYILASECTVCKRDVPPYSHTLWRPVFNHALRFPRIINVQIASASERYVVMCPNYLFRGKLLLSHPFIWALSLALTLHLTRNKQSYSTLKALYRSFARKAWSLRNIESLRPSIYVCKPRGNYV